MAIETKRGLDDVLQLLLQRPGLECWARTCMSLLALTHGIESFMDDEDENAHRDMRRLVISALPMNDPAEFFNVTQLQVFRYGAMSESESVLWQPLKESFQHFKARHGGRIRVCKDRCSHPKRTTIKKWLQTQLPLRAECQQ